MHLPFVSTGIIAVAFLSAVHIVCAVPVPITSGLRVHYGFHQKRTLTSELLDSAAQKLKTITDVQGLSGLTNEELDVAVKHGESDPAVWSKLQALQRSSGTTLKEKNAMLQIGMPIVGGDDPETRQATRLLKAYADNGEDNQVAHLIKGWKSVPPTPNELPHHAMLDSVGMRTGPDGKLVAKDRLQHIPDLSSKLGTMHDVGDLRDLSDAELDQAVKTHGQTILDFKAKALEIIRTTDQVTRTDLVNANKLRAEWTTADNVQSERLIKAFVADGRLSEVSSGLEGVEDPEVLRNMGLMRKVKSGVVKIKYLDPTQRPFGKTSAKLRGALDAITGRG